MQLHSGRCAVRDVAPTYFRLCSSVFILLWCISLSTCGGNGAGNGGNPPPGGNGTVVLFAEDQPSGNALTFRLTVDSIVLTSSAGATVTALASTEKRELEWRSRTLAPTVIKVATIPAATYTSVALTVEAPSTMLFDSASGTISETSIPVQTSTVSLPLNLTVNPGDVAGLRLDLNLRDSVQTDSTGALLFNPHFQAITVSFSTGGIPGYVDGVPAVVTNVNLSNNQFTVTLPGFVSLQPIQGPSLTVQSDSSTRFETISSLADLTPGNTLELDAQLQSSGNFLAQVIKRDTVLPGQKIWGMVIARSPASGSATSFTMLVQDADPVPTAIGFMFSFNIDASTHFRVSTEDLPLASFPNLNFDPQTLRVGQFLYAVDRQDGTGAADSITLDEISMVGQVGPSVGTSNFDFVPDGNFFAANGLGQFSVTVTSATELESMPSGLSNLNANQSIVSVRGVLVFQAGSGVLVAKRVRLLQP